MPMPEHIGIYINAASKHIRRHLDSIFYEYEHLTGTQACVLGESPMQIRRGGPIIRKILSIILVCAVLQLTA